MDDIRQYLLGVTAAAMLCAVVRLISGKSGINGAVMNLLTGIFMSVSIAAPLLPMISTGATDQFPQFREEAEDAVAWGKEEAYLAMAGSIKAKAEAYILDKAESYGAQLTVEVSMDGTDMPVPCCVRISGNISPYGKTMMTGIIEKELGIPAEEQIWTS